VLRIEQRLDDIKKQNGFTIVETMVVLAVIAILVLIAQPVFKATKAQAQKEACQANVRVMEGALCTWKAMNIDANYPQNNDIIPTLVGHGFLKTNPACPAGGNYETSNGGGTSFPTIKCSITGHSI
jgi:prepilin-type N-terminal cleavage/methylation domain-containing protein